MNNARLIIQISKGIIREHRVRRLTMFYALLATLVMIFLGATFLWTTLREHPLIFIGYWAACAWVTLLVVLLAFYDLARVRADARRERRRLEAEFLVRENRERKDDQDAR